jgi:hypothetical protein
MEAKSQDDQTSVSRPGPRTPQSKKRSKYNALKTGIFAKIVLTGKSFGERKDDFDQLVADLQQSIEPRDDFEEILIEALAFELLRLARTYQADAELAPLLFSSIREKFESDGTEEAIDHLLDTQAANGPKLPSAELLLKYETAIWRQIDRIIDRIQKWRRLRDDGSGR